MQEDIKLSKNKSAKIGKDIENILLAVAEGNRHASLMNRLSKFKGEKESLILKYEKIN